MNRHLAAAVICAAALLASATSTHAAYPGSNGRIAFERDDVMHNNPGRIFGIDPNGANLQPITDGTVDSSEPRWSPNGKLIAYVADDSSGFLRVWVASADGSSPHAVTPVANTDDEQPTWSPDGTKVAFSRFGASNGIAIANADGTGTAATIPGTTSGDTAPAWSPDGAHIAFAHSLGGGQAQIDVMNVDGGGRHTLDAPPASHTDGDPAWSPDGGTVWFERGDVQLIGCSSNSQIYAVPGNGSGPAQLISKDPSVSEYLPAPSPDGTRVAFTRCTDPNTGPLGIHHILTMNTDGTGVVPVTSGSDGDDYSPDWQPSAPLFATQPSIGGPGVDNQVLVATAGVSPGGGATTLQFERCDAQGANCVPIPGAVATRAHAAAASATYRLTSADIGHAVRVLQTQVNAVGSTSTQSPPTSAVVPSKAHCSNVFAGTAKADRITGSAGSDRINGGRGNDRLNGRAGKDCMSGGSGRDTLSGGPGNDTLSGGSGNDRISAGSGRNVVSGGSGNDRIDVRNHRRDRVNCGRGKDRVVADRGDRLRGCERVKRRR